MDRKLPKEYAKFFLLQRRPTRIFGTQINAYALSLLVLSLVGFASHENLMGLPAVLKVLMVVLFVLLHFFSVASFLAQRLSTSHNGYLQYLGFSKPELHALSCIVAIPLNLAIALLILPFLIGAVSTPFAIVLSISVFAISEFLAPALMMLGQHLDSRGRSKTKRCKNASSIAKSFSNPYRSFFRKDISSITTSDRVGLAAISLLGFFVMLFSNFFDSKQAYALCLYTSMSIPTYALCGTIFSKESKSYHLLYRPLIRMKDSALLVRKFPLQLLAIVLYSATYSLFSFTLYGFSFERAVISIALILYFGLTSFSISLIHLRRIRERKVFDSLYEIILLPIVLVPCLAIVAAVVLVLSRTRSSRGSRTC